MHRSLGYLMAAVAGALSLLGLAAMSMAAYLDDSVMFFIVLGLWCLCGLFFNRWMLNPAREKGGYFRRLWLWSLAGCWAWPLGVVCGLSLRLVLLENLDNRRQVNKPSLRF